MGTMSVLEIIQLVMLIANSVPVIASDVQQLGAILTKLHSGTPLDAGEQAQVDALRTSVTTKLAAMQALDAKGAPAA
jgi:hypothetical protein